MIYFLIFTGIAVWSFFDLYVDSAVIKNFPVLALVLFAAFRSVNVGIDTKTYANDYVQELWGYMPTQRFERGFELFQKIISSMNAPLWVFFFLVAFFTLSILNQSYSKYTNLSVVALLYYFSRFFINRELNQIRSGLAAAILMYSLKWVNQRKFWPFFFTVIIATQFHSAALIMLLVYPLVIIVSKMKTKILFFYVVVLVGSVMFSIVGQKLVTMIVQWFGHGVAYVNYSGYIEGNGLANPVILLQIVISFSATYIYSKQKKQSVVRPLINESVLSMYILSTVILISLSNFAVLAGRLSTLLATAEPLLIIATLKAILPDSVIVISMVVLSAFVLYVVFVHTGQLSMNYEPYIFTFQ